MPQQACEDVAVGDALRGWQHRAAAACDAHALEMLFATAALLLSGAYALRAFTILPVSIPCSQFRVLAGPRG